MVAILPPLFIKIRRYQMGNFSAIYEVLEPFITDFTTFLQAVAIITASAIAIYYKLREIMGNPQEDQMYNHKTKNVFIATAFIFLIPTIMKIISAYFQSGSGS
jgi:hypothetical protein